MVEKLSFNSCKLGDEGLIAIAETLVAKGVLKVLLVDNNQITVIKCKKFRPKQQSSFQTTYLAGNVY